MSDLTRMFIGMVGGMFIAVIVIFLAALVIQPPPAVAFLGGMVFGSVGANAGMWAAVRW